MTATTVRARAQTCPAPPTRRFDPFCSGAAVGAGVRHLRFGRPGQAATGPLTAAPSRTGRPPVAGSPLADLTAARVAGFGGFAAPCAPSPPRPNLRGWAMGWAMGWAEFALAIGAFLLSHAVPVRAPVRPWAEKLLGPPGVTLAHSALSVAVLAWLIAAAGRAPFVPLWDWEPWRDHVALAVMLPARLILTLAIGRPDPFSFGGAHDGRFDPARPGVVGATRHPLLAALALWAGAHMLANGDVAHVALFGGVTFPCGSSGSPA